MYIFGVDIPIVEVIFAVGVVGIILLLEITIVLILITYHMRNSRRIEDKIVTLITALASLNKAELKELGKIKTLEAKEKDIVGRLRKTLKKLKRKKKKPLLKKPVPEQGAVGEETSQPPQQGGEIPGNQ